MEMVRLPAPGSTCSFLLEVMFDFKEVSIMISVCILTHRCTCSHDNIKLANPLNVFAFWGTYLNTSPLVVPCTLTKVC